METTYYTLTAREILVEGDAVRKASGDGTRQLVCVRRESRQPNEQAAGKVIDLAAWKADREEERRLEELWYDGVDEALEEPAAAAEPRVHRDHRRSILVGGELLATLSVVAVMAALLIQIF